MAATMFASDFSFNSASSSLPHPKLSSFHSPITPLDVIFTTTSSPSHSNFCSSPNLNPTDDDDEGAARAIIVSAGRRMSKSTKIPAKDKVSYSPSTSSYTPPSNHHFNNSPPPSYSSNERSHPRKARPAPLELHSSPNDAGRSRSSYFPTSPTSSRSRPGISASAQVSEAGAEGHGRRMSTVVVGMERRSSVDQEREEQKIEKKTRAVVVGPGTIGFESCIAGALAHEKKARSYGEGASTKALHHFTRASDLLSLALQERPDGLEALVYKSSVVHTLAVHYLTPNHALHSLQTLVKALRAALLPTAVPSPPHQIVAAQTQLASLTHLLATLTESLYLSLLPRAIWAGETGDLIRESVALWEQVMASEKAFMLAGSSPVIGSSEWESGVQGDEEELAKHRLRRSSSVCNRPVNHATMLDGYLRTAEAASYAAGLSTELLTADRYFDLAEDALTSALRMGALIDLKQATPRPDSIASFPTIIFDCVMSSSASSTSSDATSTDYTPPPPAPISSHIVNKVRLRCGPLKIERLRHTNALAPQLPINHAQGRAILTEMKALSSELDFVLRETPSSVSSTIRSENKAMFVQSVAQLGDAQFVLAQLLKRTWRKKGGLKMGGVAGRKGSAFSFEDSRKLSSTSSSSSISDSASLGQPLVGPSGPSAIPRRLSGSEPSRRTSQSAPRQGSFTIDEEEEEEEEERSESRDVEQAQSFVGRMSSVSTGFGSGKSSGSSSSSSSPPVSPRRGSLAHFSSGSRKASVPPCLGSAYNPSPRASANVIFSSPFGPPPIDSTLLQTGYDSPSDFPPTSILTNSRRPSHAVSSTPLSSSMSMAAYRRASAASDGQEEHDSSVNGGPSTSGWAQRKPSVAPLSSSTSSESLIFPLSPTAPAAYSSSELAEQAWDFLSSAVKNHKIALSLLKPSSASSASSTTSSYPFTSSPSNVAYQRANLLLSISSSSYFQASLASRVQAAKVSRTSLLVKAEVYATWAARELGWSWLIENGESNPSKGLGKEEEEKEMKGNGSGLISRATALGMKALFTCLRTIWHKAVTGIPGEVHKEEKRLAKEKVERITLRMKNEMEIGPYDVTRYKIGLERLEGEFEAGESLYWSNVSRNLRDGLQKQ